MSKHLNDYSSDDQLEVPFEIEDLDPNINKKLLQDFGGERTGFIQVGKKKWFFPNAFRHHISRFHDFEVRPNDVWIVTFPRSGTTVTQELIWLLLNDLDYKTASQITLFERYPFMEANCMFHPEFRAELLQENINFEENYKLIKKLSESVCDHLDQMKERRFIKTHLPLSLLPKNLLTVGCKVIYIARNPKDLAVSYYHHNRLIRVHGFKKDFPTFWEYFSNNLVVWAPYWEHILEAWKENNRENMLFLFYENLNKNLKESIINIQNFLGTKFTDDQLSLLENHLKIDNFRKNSSVNYSLWRDLGIFDKNEQSFIRKGKTGESKSYFDENLEKKANDWIELHLKDTDLKFPAFN
ncbi:hypothetical protein WA026_007438 [Henosepilachna vigintioctopunctata]|uniref:Sulfotransferase domain-containing protein n=1 Tax=Henosepilachna vigintioctopunctata TaxID=420089 RepID=A0AAW1UVT9_9CUCU